MRFSYSGRATNDDHVLLWWRFTPRHDGSFISTSPRIRLVCWFWTSRRRGANRELREMRDEDDQGCRSHGGTRVPESRQEILRCPFDREHARCHVRKHSTLLAQTVKPVDLKDFGSNKEQVFFQFFYLFRPYYLFVCIFFD